MKKLAFLFVLSLLFCGTVFAEDKEDTKPAIELSWQLEAKQLQLQNVQLEFRYLQERMKVLQYQAKSLQAEIRKLTAKKAEDKKVERIK